MAYNIFSNILKDLGDGEQAQYIKDKIAINLVGQIDLGNDPFLADVLSQIRFEGTEGSTTIVDDKGNTISNSTSVISLNYAALGSSSSLYHSTGRSGINVNIASATAVGDFTLEFFARVPDFSGTKAFLGPWSNKLLFRYSSNQFQLYLPGVTTTANIAGTSAAVDTWQHYTVHRSGSALAIGLEGTIIATNTNSSAIDFSNIVVGRERYNDGGADPFIGNIDAFRFTNACRYATSGTYTVPTTYASI